ncbi:IMP cyclohydrolase [Desulfobaculum bizertense]|uniref:Phosphoribosylaminoimidazolecarboxamide formyltransferase / IMP cyclohydrolase n=1 Tax=Desulfobaculum bizertense DSM 18034 TaxID=1121442 RepID=A0A1T4WSQ2_9BACT|nr:IMP cyclohydrolase [Desulfobaculum bizertense]UIJ37308.1 IMP cyclohydrolase [Desulfobaculum bizertense]SKA79641.1 phosphoribosylaminoimidazolecarboxamide formyltransferase / IMP cyclohydrolase [Desulfobaculum bizertense DSM 18034]
MEHVRIRRAILSVTDKSGLVEFARFLADNDVELFSTGGTRRMLLEAGLDVKSVSDVTGFPEIMNGRVKTLHPHIHAGILADKDNKEHMQTLKDLDLAPFDLVCVNLYNFADAAAKELDLKSAIEQIDIGGPCMLRASAKNFHSVLVVPGTAHYERITKELAANDMQAPLALRKDMAAATFRQTNQYDGMIADYLEKHDA